MNPRSLQADASSPQLAMLLMLFRSVTKHAAFCEHVSGWLSKLRSPFGSLVQDGTQYLGDPKGHQIFNNHTYVCSYVHIWRLAIFCLESRASPNLGRSVATSAFVCEARMRLVRLLGYTAGYSIGVGCQAFAHALHVACLIRTYWLFHLQMTIEYIDTLC